MSSEVLEMYETLDNEARLEVEKFIRGLVSKNKSTETDILSEFEKMRGSISEEDAEAAYQALAECRKIDYGEW